MSDEPELSAREVEALKEVSGYRGLYWYREKTMQRLQAKGLVETWEPPSVAERPRMVARPWRITANGTQALNCIPASTPEPS